MMKFSGMAKGNIAENIEKSRVCEIGYWFSQLFKSPFRYFFYVFKKPYKSRDWRTWHLSEKRLKIAKV